MSEQKEFDNKPKIGTYETTLVHLETMLAQEKDPHEVEILKKRIAQLEQGRWLREQVPGVDEYLKRKKKKE